ncbi:hypothetical protein F01_550014 [Burkholderia cenocepacia]|nr:hypothetical protein F01_550014 [Burkholderia cenocepacia]
MQRRRGCSAEGRRATHANGANRSMGLDNVFYSNTPGGDVGRVSRARQLSVMRDGGATSPSPELSRLFLISFTN